MVPEPTVVLVTGANQGIGRGIAEALLARPNYVVIAAVRNLDTTLKEIRPAEHSKLLLVKIENESSSDPAAAVQQIHAAGIANIDLVIANAGICPTSAYLRVEDIQMEQLRSLFEVNTFSFVSLFQAVRPLLKATADRKGESQAKLLVISSNAGQVVEMESLSQVMLASYGSSKVALNYLVRRVHFENQWLTAWVMNPGFVQTESGNATAKVFGMQEAPHTIDISVGGLLSKADSATRSNTSGKFFSFNGTEMLF
ncbi:putative aflatoxin biosynthesis ketoreductase nor-1 [Seiridium unicorne]|uniref:Aflatoxin biosynthesis ketoreductase nor-1 n=1 Tax=Seiridium unicorne TaxID=138068 RepID=A0ABR2V7J9_9PEZI